MKLQFKTLSRQSFTIDAEPSEKVFYPIYLYFNLIYFYFFLLIFNRWINRPIPM